MTREGWKEAVLMAMDKYRNGDPSMLDLLADLLEEQDEAKAALQRAGFGCCGRPWRGMVQDVLEAVEGPR